MKNLLRTLFVFSLIVFAGFTAIAQMPRVIREGTGVACQADVTVMSMTAASTTYRYEWLVAPESHVFQINPVYQFKVLATLSGGAVYVYYVTKSAIDANPNVYYVAYPQGGGTALKLYIKNDIPAYPNKNQYTFRFQL
ncbi:hypothetical protein TH53_01655 [Pedobacter lusitanus]|uniref:Uncharacterized protein n=1 Tax=Pedobacter lusitanus TaxID=1503925 RepID=A0A0D0GRJ0_9SPHI|nr:hypothetical protein [Pedobacter lusitanus]KIO78815.1 hypothetical protein TH53_01655 [Pedobacter lusitanus]